MCRRRVKHQVERIPIMLRKTRSNMKQRKQEQECWSKVLQIPDQRFKFYSLQAVHKRQRSTVTETTIRETKSNITAKQGESDANKICMCFLLDRGALPPTTPLASFLRLPKKVAKMPAEHILYTCVCVFSSLNLEALTKCKPLKQLVKKTESIKPTETPSKCLTNPK